MIHLVNEMNEPIFSIRSLSRGIVLHFCFALLSAAFPCFAGAAAPLEREVAGAIPPLGVHVGDTVGDVRPVLTDTADALRGRTASPDTVRGEAASLPDTVVVERMRAALPDTVVRMERIWTIEELDSVLASAAGEETTEGTSWQRRKNSRVAMLCALLFPGLGQIYNEKPYKAAIVLGAETFYLSSILLNYRYAAREEDERDRYAFGTSEWQEHNAWMVEYKERMTDWIWWSAGAMLIIVLDAYVDAHLHDMDFEVEGMALGDGTGVALVVNF